MSSILITILAYFIDKKFGEFSFIKHPIITFGEMIQSFEDKFYENSIQRGALLVVSMLSITLLASLVLEFFLNSLFGFLNILLSSLIASVFVAHTMLIQSVKEVIEAKDIQRKRENISKLVSRDCEHMSESDIYKASIESYAENLSDGVVAPLFYLLLFGIPGIVVYKMINTMDSMVGYKTNKYENYGKVAAKLDDIANFIPSRLTAMLMMLSSKVARKKYGLLGFYKDGSKHESPNAGHPITAAALILGVRLGGDTKYFGVLKTKPYFGVGRKNITKEDVQNVLRILV